MIVIVMVVAAAAMMFLPEYTNKAQTGNGVLAKEISYKESVSGRGTITSGEAFEINSPYPVVAEKILCSVGDYVKKGSPLVSIDKKSTIAAYLEILTGIGLNLQTTTIAKATELLSLLPEEIAKEIPVDMVTINETIRQNSDPSMLIKDVLTQENIISEICATKDGFITDINANYTALSDIKQPIIKGSTTNALKATVAIKEANISNIKIGQKVQLYIEAIERDIVGTVEGISQNARKANAMQNAYTVVDVCVGFKENFDIKQGYTVVANVVCSEEKTAVAVPFEAVNQDEDNKEYVYCLENNRSVKKYIEIVKETTTTVLVANGIDAAEVVIIDNDEIIQGEQYCLKKIVEIPME